MAENCRIFKWTSKKLKCAKLLAEGTLSHEDVAEVCAVGVRTIYNWKEHPEFLAKIDEFTLAHERATKAGILRQAIKTLGEKSLRAADDKTTELDYLKFIADLVGVTDQKPQVQFNFQEMNITESRERITSRINSIAARIGPSEDTQ